MAQVLQKLAQARAAGDGPEKLAGLEIECPGCRGRLPTRIKLDPRNCIPGIRCWIAVDGIVIEYTYYLGHLHPRLVALRVSSLDRLRSCGVAIAFRDFQIVFHLK